jgi:hypothetical protein
LAAVSGGWRQGNRERVPGTSLANYYGILNPEALAVVDVYMGEIHTPLLLQLCVEIGDEPAIDTRLVTATLFTGKHSHIKALFDKSLEEHSTPRARKELEDKLPSFKS